MADRIIQLTDKNGDKVYPIGVTGLPPAMDLVNIFYPVGSIYISTESTFDPNTAWGGTWVAWGAGKVPVGVDASDTDFDTAEKTGGEKTHTLTTSEMPSHTHNLFKDTGENFGFQGGSYTGYYVTAQQGSMWQNSLRAGSTGGSQAHNNLQPYITCYMWKRTA